MMQVRWSLTPTSAQKKRGGSSKDLTELDGSSSRVQQISAMGPGVANSSAADALDQQWARRMPSYDAGAIADELTAVLSRSCASDTDGNSESGSSPTQAASADEGFDPLSLLGDLEGFNSSTMSFTSGAHAPPVGASHSADSTTTQKSASAEAADRKGGESTGMSRAMTQLDLLSSNVSSNVSLRGQRHECDARVKQLEAEGAYEAPVSAHEEGSLDLSVPLDLCHSRSSASHAPPSSSPALSDASQLSLCSQQQEHSSPLHGSKRPPAAVGGGAQYGGGRLAGRRETRSLTSIHLDMFAELDGLGEAELGLISPGLSAPHRRTASGGCATDSSVEEDEDENEGFGSLDEEFEEALEECLPHDLVPGAGVGSELRTALEALTADSAVLANLDVALDQSHDPSDVSSDGADEDGFVHSMGLSMGGQELFDFEGLRPSSSARDGAQPRGGSSSGAYTWSPALDHLKMTSWPLASDRWLAKARGEPMAEDASDGLKKRKRSGKPFAEGLSKAYGATDELGTKKAKKEPKQPKAPGGANGLSWQLSWRMTTWGPHGLQQGPGAPPDATAAAPPPPPQPQPQPQPQPLLLPSQPPSQPLQPLQQQPQQQQLKLPSPPPPPPPPPQLPPPVHMGGMPASQPVTAPYNRLSTPPVLLPAVLPPSGVAMPGPMQLKRPDAPAPLSVSPAPGAMAPGAGLGAVIPGAKSNHALSQALTATGAIPGANAKSSGKPAPGVAPVMSSGKPAVAPRAFSWQTLKILSAHKRDEPRPRGKGGALLPAPPPKAGAAPPYLQQQMYSPSAVPSAGQPRPGAPPLPPPTRA